MIGDMIVIEERRAIGLVTQAVEVGAEIGEGKEVTVDIGVIEIVDIGRDLHQERLETIGQLKSKIY
jgi:hypothetical protein